MALDNPPQEALQAEVAVIRSPEEREDEQELEKLELEVKQIAKKLLEFRATLPDQLKTTLASILSIQRPILPDIDLNSGSDPGPSPGSCKEARTSKTALLTEEDQNTTDKVCLLKDKISSNASATAVVLKRMKECISKIDKLDSDNGIIHPAFKKKKIF